MHVLGVEDAAAGPACCRYNHRIVEREAVIVRDRGLMNIKRRREQGLGRFTARIIAAKA